MKQCWKFLNLSTTIIRIINLYSVYNCYHWEMVCMICARPTVCQLTRFYFMLWSMYVQYTYMRTYNVLNTVCGRSGSSYHSYIVISMKFIQILAANNNNAPCINYDNLFCLYSLGVLGDVSLFSLSMRFKTLQKKNPK